MRRSICYSLISCLSVLLWITPTHTVAQGQQSAMLVIEGGTLIDGNGGTPVRDALIIIQGNKITAVSRKGQVSYPATAQVIKADGRFILPGLWEAESVYGWYMGEAYLANGVTSTSDIGTGGEVSSLHSSAIKHGKAGGPRTFAAIAYMSARDGGRGTGFETPLTPNRVPKSAPEARDITKRLVAAGADMIMFADGGLPAEYVQAAAEEAHRAGLPLVARPTGPLVYPRDAVLAGADILSHAAGVDIAIAKDFDRWKDNQHNLDTEAYSDMDDAKAVELTKFLVWHNVTLAPILIRKGMGFPKAWLRFEEQDRKLFADLNFLTYYPQAMIQSVLANYMPRTLEPSVRERRSLGYQNATRFFRQFVEAGGRILAGGNAPGNCAPGLCLHHELEIFAEAGFTPMQIIQSATKWPAEAFKVQDKLGTIAVGKLADLLIVNADPLQSISNLQKIDQIIFDGKAQDRTYHSWYRTTFMGSTEGGGNPVVEGLPWMVSLKQATFRPPAGGGGEDGADPVRLPPPGIETISPYIVTQGNPTLTLTIKGFNFFRRSQVYFDNLPVPFRRVSPTELQATIDENLLRRVGRFEIKVKNPPPLAIPEAGDGTSNTAHMLVDFKY